MKIKTALWILSIVMLFGPTAYAQNKVGNTEWKVRMRALLTDVIALMPYAFDEAKYRDPKNAETIKEALDSLAAHSVSLKDHTAKLKTSADGKVDPGIRYISQAFENDIGAAQVAFSGSADAQRQSQTYLRAALAKCMMCHSQASNGPEVQLEQFKGQFEKLNYADRFQAYAATRQFDEALEVFSKTLRDAKVSKPDESIVDREVKAALAIAVRVKRDPNLALKLINEVEASKAASRMTQADLKDWKNAVIQWQNESQIDRRHDQSLYMAAKKLASNGKATKSVNALENSNIQMLRASSLLHDLLTNFPKSSLRGDAYLLLATTYEMLPGFSAWDLPDEYLGACIEEFSHTETSERCYKKYQEITVLGYSGSSGVHVPTAVIQHLQRMKELATIKR